MRKAQRLREEVALGQQKTSIQRLWPGIQIQILQSMAEKSESVISSDGEIVELLPISWITDITNKSIVTGQVSPSQRLLVIERDIQILKFIDHVSLNVENPELTISKSCKKISTIEHYGGRWRTNCGKFA